MWYNFNGARTENAMTLLEEIQNGENVALEFKEESSSLNAEIDRVLSEIMEKLKGIVSRENAGWFLRDKLPFGAAKASAKEK